MPRSQSRDEAFNIFRKMMHDLMDEGRISPLEFRVITFAAVDYASATVADARHWKEPIAIDTGESSLPHPRTPPLSP